MDAQRWLADALDPLVPRFPGLAASIEASAALPLELTDLVGIELRLDPAAATEPAALHVQVMPEATPMLRLATTASAWPEHERSLPGLLAELIDDGRLGREHGFVLDDVGDGQLAPAALYAGCDGLGAAEVRAVTTALGAPPATLALLAAHPALARASHVGVMTARPDRPVRLVLSARDVTDEVWAALARLDGADTATLQRAKDLLEPVAGSTEGHLDIDLVGPRLGPVVGVERKDPGAELLGEAGIPLRQWAGVRYLGRLGAPATEADVRAAVHGREITRESRLVNHAKTVVTAGVVRETKAYLAVHRRQVVRRGADASDQAGTEA